MHKNFGAYLRDFLGYAPFFAQLLQRTHGVQLNISAFSARLKLNFWVCFVPFITDNSGVIFIRAVLNRRNSGAVILLAERLALKHQVFCGGQSDNIKAIGDCSAVIRLNLNALNIDGGVLLSETLGQPKADGLSAKVNPCS